MLGAALLHGCLAQTQWRKLLPWLVFTLNTTISKATHCVPFNVVFGRSTILPQDIVFKDIQSASLEHSSVNVYEQDLRTTLNDIYNLVIESLEISKTNMQCHYNKYLHFVDYKLGQKFG